MRLVVVSLQYAVGRRLTAVNNSSTNDDDRHRLFIAAHRIYFFQATICFWGLQRQYSRLAKYLAPRRIYVLIDNIAPAGMKASYFSAQRWAGWRGGKPRWPAASSLPRFPAPSLSLS